MEVGHEPVSDLQARGWARGVTADPVHGTVYEIEIYWESGQNGAQGTRLILWQDPHERWHYAGTLEGDSWDRGFTTKNVSADLTPSIFRFMLLGRCVRANIRSHACTEYQQHHENSFGGRS